MSISDPIANLIVSIKNKAITNKGELLTVFSKYKKEILDALKKKNVIYSYTVKDVDGKRMLDIKLNKFYTDISRISKPGRRIYSKASTMPVKKESIIIVSTSKGLMTSFEARKNHLGGELLMEIK